jgi:hypothetical protein
MPYTVRKVGGKYQVTHAGKVFGTHPSHAAAMKQITAIVINEHKSK